MYNFKNLVFEGGGVKGIAYAGALEELEAKGYLKNIKRVAGTSAGAITATLLALNYSVADVKEVISNTNFKDFEDGSWFFPANITRVLRNYGWFKGDKFLSWISKLIEAKTGSANTTFKQLQELNYKQPYRELYVINTNLTQQRSDILSHETTPEMPIKTAVRMSMSIPLFFQSVNWAGDVIVDGGVAWNFPVNIFDNTKYLFNKNNGTAVDYNTVNGYVFNHETLGFRLDSEKEIQLNGMGWESEPTEIKSIKEYLIGLANFLTEVANKRHLHENDWNRTVFIDTLGVKSTEFSLKQEKITALIESGRNRVKKYFEWRDADQSLSKLPV